MKNLLSAKGHLIARCIVFQIAMSLMGFFVISAVAFQSRSIILIAGLFTMLFYFAITGASLNEDGLKDELIMSRNRQKSDPCCGLKYVALSYIPSFLLTLIASVFRTFNVFTGVADTLIMIIRFFFSGMYLGIDMFFFITGTDKNGYAVYNLFSANGYSLLLYQIFSVVVCGLIYYLGVKGINLLKGKEKK